LNSLTPDFDSGNIDRGFLSFIKGANDNIEFTLSYVGEQFVNWARSVDSYKDRTGNLRASVGYMIVRDGIVIKEVFPGVFAAGVAEGRKAALEAVGGFSEGYVLIVVAGMDYAAAVESKGFDVLSGSISPAEKLLKKLVRDLNL